MKPVNEILRCADCRGKLAIGQGELVCLKCGRDYPVEAGVVKMMTKVGADLKLSTEKWDWQYKCQLESGSFRKVAEDYNRYYTSDVVRQLLESATNRRVYLEIGCGQFFLGQALAKEYDLVVGVDVCPSALKIAKLLLDEKKIKNYLLVQADILKLPVADKVVSTVYGGGVIEHFRDTVTCVRELYRVLEARGNCFNTVPMLNLSTFTWRQLWGNVADIEGLRQIMEFVHMRLLQGRHMKYGYEKSFSMTKMKKIYKMAGFKRVEVGKFDIVIPGLAGEGTVKKMARWMLNRSWFWPVIKVNGIK